MLILILIDIQYSQKAVFSFEKCSNQQNHSSSGSLHPVNRIARSKTYDSLPTSGGGIRPPPSPHPSPLAQKPCINGTNFLPTPKSPTFKNIFGLFPKIRFFPGCITFSSLRKQKFV